MILVRRRNAAVLSLLGGVLLAASCGGDPVDAGTGGDGDGDVGDGDGDVGDGDGEVGDGDGDVGDGDGDTGGMPGDGDGAGGSSSGGDEGTGGALDTSTGGDEGSGGDQGSGTGGDQGTVTTATLGEPCGAPGAFACAETNPKLALICGGDNEWEFRETCEEEQFCDSYEGLGLGTCRVPLPECEAPDGPFCEGATRVVECLEGGFETQLLEECGTGYACQVSSCVEVPDDCPVSNGLVFNCAGDQCEGSSAECSSNASCENSGAVASFGVSGPTAVRLPTDGLCTEGQCDREYLTILINPATLPDKGSRVTVGPGWGLIASADQQLDRCGEIVEGCVVVPALEEGETWRSVALFPLTDNALVRNVTIEPVEPGTTCD